MHMFVLVQVGNKRESSCEYQDTTGGHLRHTTTLHFIPTKMAANGLHLTVWLATAFLAFQVMLTFCLRALRVTIFMQNRDYL